MAAAATRARYALTSPANGTPGPRRQARARMSSQGQRPPSPATAQVVLVAGARPGAADSSVAHQVRKQFGSSGWCSLGLWGDHLHLACLLRWQR